MYPKLFEIGPFPVYSYGLMLGLAFIIGSWLFGKELQRNKYDEGIGIVITFLSLIGGIIGSKLFYIIEDWNFGKGQSLESLLSAKTLFSAAGLTFYGGLILSILFIYLYCKKKKLNILRIFDLMAPSAILGYGIARIGCHLSGDGDYGKSVNGTFWEFLGYSYSNGTVPTKAGELVHPTPLYELVAAIIIFFILWFMRKKMKYAGELFGYYLIFIGIERFLVEIIRLNPQVIWFLSQAQIISLIFVILGVMLIYFKYRLQLIKK
jgi:phosphatidylglycerol---prolipoprotein diacylglyceryl transferase